MSLFRHRPRLRAASRRAQFPRLRHVAPSASRYRPLTMLKMDVTENALLQNAMNAILEREGRIDIVVNNAGIA